MRKLVLSAYVLLVAAITVNAQQTDFPKLTGPYDGQKPPGLTPESYTDEIKLQKVTQNLYMISSPVAGNVAFLVTEAGVLCVDAMSFPYQGEKVVERIRQITDKPIKYLVYTHYHGDHTRGAQSFHTSTVIIAHQNTLKHMEEESAARIKQDITINFPRQLKALEEKVAKLKAAQSPELQEAEKELELKRFQINDCERLKIVFPDITIAEKACIHLGNNKVELIYLGKGHTDGDILIHFLEEKVICTGDLLSHPGEEEERIKSLDIKNRLEKMEPAQKKMMIQSMENQIKALEKIVAIDFEKAMPGHGKMTGKKGVIDNLAFSTMFLAELKKMVE